MSNRNCSVYEYQGADYDIPRLTDYDIPYSTVLDPIGIGTCSSGVFTPPASNYIVLGTIYCTTDNPSVCSVFLEKNGSEDTSQKTGIINTYVMDPGSFIFSIAANGTDTYSIVINHTCGVGDYCKLMQYGSRILFMNA